jgi:hypothetical protein
MRLIDLTGKQVGRLTVISRAKNRGKDTSWNCECECGRTYIAWGTSLRRADIASCGCYRRDRLFKHGHAAGDKRRNGYGIWSAMKDRCSNPSNQEFNGYGGRGIKVCESWASSFEKFIEDMGPRTSRKHSIDRINNNGNYEPGNCRWATREEQDNNRSNNIMIEYNGNKMTVRQAVKAAGNVVLVATARWRVKNGWSSAAAVETPTRD